MVTCACDLEGVLMVAMGRQAVEELGSRWPSQPFESFPLETGDWTFGALFISCSDVPSLDSVRALADRLRPRCEWFFVGCTTPAPDFDCVAEERATVYQLAHDTGCRVLWARFGATLQTIVELLEDVHSPGCIGWDVSDTPFAASPPVIHIESARLGTQCSNVAGLSSLFVVMRLHDAKGLHDGDKLCESCASSVPDDVDLSFHLLFVEDRSLEGVTFVALESNEETTRTAPRRSGPSRQR